MEKKTVLRNAILLSLLVGATAVYSPAVMAAEAVNEEAMEFAMEEYVVTASRTQTAKVDTPANVSTIDAAKIESRRYQDVAEALKDVPGAVVMDNGYGANEKNIILNGDDRVLVLVDGRRVNIDMGSTSGKSTFDLNLLPDVSQIERIEVVKGHGGSLYGSDAVGGVINIITKKTDHSYGKVGFSAGSHKYKEGKALYNFKEGKTGVSVSASKIKQSYYKYKDALTGNTQRWPGESNYENEKVALRIDQELSDTTNLSVGYNFSKFEGTSPWRATTPWPQRVFKKSNEFNAKYSWMTKDTDEGYLQTYYKKYSYFNDGGMDEKDFGLELQQSITTSANNKLVVGASYRNSKAENEIAYDESSINNLAIFANNMWEFAPTWTLNTGARWDKHSKAGSKTTLSAGLNKKFDENSHAYVNWGQVFKAPTIDDLYYNNPYMKGNPNLNPEKGDTFTVGYGTKLNDKTDINVSYFYSDLDDAIAWEWDENGNGEAKNINRQKKNGIELSINHELNDNWDLEASYTYVRVRNDNNDGAGFVRDVNYAPNTYRLGVRYHDEKWNADLTMRAGSGADTQRLNADHKNAFIDSCYVTFDMAASYKATKDWTIFAKGYNLFNKAYAEHAGVTGGRYDYPAQSRRFIVGAEYSF
ncbi:TonB-dependent receptor [Phascolarctobacterium sp.]|uniref:TonB-dependent receptor plug domain-containing protein n=1 Tax=Phascolarctobacterium sp. TaxID=2049039 RepID=UPI002A7EDEBA|nr:TonB-dependent receptor [Phascolarctobacterium sp.]MDY5044284.1 TonB-dependent receptor [Phascolarctobacterium sp.]